MHPSAILPATLPSPQANQQISRLRSAARPSAGWLSPWTGSFGSLSNSFLLAVFIYWGWDCALSVNEETKDSARTPDRAAVMATLMLVVIFAVVSTAALVYAGPAFLAAHSTDVLGAMATSVLGSTPGKLLVLCVLTAPGAVQYVLAALRELLRPGGEACTR